MKEIIELSVKGGYMPCEFCTEGNCFVSENGSKGLTNHIWFNNALGEGCAWPLSHILLDPAFWSSLGKALGWGEMMFVQWHDMNPLLLPPKVQSWDKVPQWQYQMHAFTDHLISGKDADSFFTALLAKEK